MHDTPIVRAKDVTAAMLLDGVEIAKPKKGQRYPKDHTTDQTYRYLDIITAFDIETSTYRFGAEVGDVQSWMYIFQWQFGDRYTVIGRTWTEWLALVEELNKYLHDIGPDVRLLTFVHNLAFEYQYISGVWHFEPIDVFATDLRSPLYCKLEQIEMRCSYRLSNYDLETWADEMRVDHRKMDGDLDYSVTRYAWTELTDEEMRYCVNDVMAVVECVTVAMHLEGDTLYSLPYTSTGYIRRRVKFALRKWGADAVKSMDNTLETYDHLRQAFRGGDTHASRFWLDGIYGNISSYDRSSSYPDVIVHCKFPMTAFRPETPTMETFQRLLDRGRAVLMKVEFWGLELRDFRTGDPYIPIAKCREKGFIPPKPWTDEKTGKEYPVDEDNGRILKAGYCSIAITDIDFEIIQETYKWQEISIEWMESARYGKLPKPLTDLVIQLYKEKTSLKGKTTGDPAEDELIKVRYAHTKALLNAVYGLFATKVINPPILFTNGRRLDGCKTDELWQVPEYSRSKLYDKAMKSVRGPYQWSVWVTSWARYRLWEGIRLAEEKNKCDKVWDFVYCDTDSVKAFGEVDFSAYNELRIKAAKESGAVGIDAKGNPHYMGVFEYEGTYDFFGRGAPNATQ